MTPLAPTIQPTIQPTLQPTIQPTIHPTNQPCPIHGQPSTSYHVSVDINVGSLNGFFSLGFAVWTSLSLYDLVCFSFSVWRVLCKTSFNFWQDYLESCIGRAKVGIWKNQLDEKHFQGKFDILDMVSDGTKWEKSILNFLHSLALNQLLGTPGFCYHFSRNKVPKDLIFSLRHFSE